MTNLKGVDAMVTTYQLTLDDFLAFQNDMIHHSNQYKRARGVWLKYMNLPLFALGYAAAFFLVPHPDSIGLSLLITVGIGLLFALLLRPLLKDLHAPLALWQTRRALNKQDTWPKDVTLQLSDTTVEMHAVRGNVHRTTQVPWTSILKVNENETHRFLYYEEDEALIIPKVKDGVTEVEQSEIERILDKHMNTEKHTSSR